MSVSAGDPTSLLTGSAAVQLGIAALKSAEQTQASVLELFRPAQYGQLGQVTATRGNLVNMVV